LAKSVAATPVAATWTTLTPSVSRIVYPTAVAATWSVVEPSLATVSPGRVSLEYAAIGRAHYATGSLVAHYHAPGAPIHAAAATSRLHVAGLGRLHYEAHGRLHYLVLGGLDFSPSQDVADYSGAGVLHFEAEGETDYHTANRTHHEAMT